MNNEINNENNQVRGTTENKKEYEKKREEWLAGKILKQCVECGGWIKSNSAQCNYCFIKFYGYPKKT